MRGRRLPIAIAAGVCLVAAAPASAQTTTVGVDVNHSSNGTGACGGMTPADKPCVMLHRASPSNPVTAPCDGTVVRFRINGLVTADRYRLRAVSDNGNGTFTGTATSPAVTIQSDGVNTFPTGMPVKRGQFIGLEFMDATVVSVRYFYGGPGGGFASTYIYSFPADGTPDTPTGNEDSAYLFNADVTCGSAQATPTCTKKKKKKKGKKKSAAQAKKKKKKPGCKKKKKRKKKKN
jgi:hypothetical protein